jgi:ABC-2 type transport system permease protein
MAAWIAFALGIARWQFLRALKSEELLTAPSRAASSRRESTLAKLRSRFTGLFPGATGILLDKELRSLVRMPRFRVVFLLACVFSVIVFLPLQMQLRDGDGFFARHGLQVMNLYGLLILSDVLLWNVFGFDRSAAQIYFVTPVDLASVIRAKNVTAGVFMAIETLLCVLAALLFRVRVTPLTLISNLCGAGVATLLFLCIGNISSVSSPRAADPKATLRKQNNGMVQLWLLGCTVCAGVLLGAAYLAGWAMDSEWAAIAVLGLELGIGAIAYRFSVESAVARLTSNREAFLSALDKSSSPVSA